LQVPDFNLSNNRSPRCDAHHSAKLSGAATANREKIRTSILKISRHGNSGISPNLDFSAIKIFF